MQHESVSRLRHADRNLFGEIVSKLARFAEDYGQQVKYARPTLPDALSDRDQDNWEPLLAIASCAGEEWLKRATAAALKLSNSGEKSVSISNQLLMDIQEIFASKKVERISTANLIAALIDDQELPWSTYNRGKPLSPSQLAKQLRPYDISSKTVRFGHSNTLKGYDLSQFTDAFARYLAPPDLPSQGNDAPDANDGEDSRVTDDSDVTDDQLQLITKAEIPPASDEDF